MINKVYVVCKDDGTGVPAGIYMSIFDALFASIAYNPDIAEFFIGKSDPNWVESAYEIRKKIGSK